jgi:uncharacterized protein YbjT (DUF2867 family)
MLGVGLGTLPAMEVLVIGGHGKVSLRLLRLLARDGHRGRGVIRKAGQASDLGVTRFVIVSSIGTHDLAGAAAAMRPYLQAKRDADDALKQSGLEWTIVKPGHLTDSPGSGRVQVSRTFGGRADIPRDDVALVLLECLHAPNTIGVEFELFEGDLPAREAVRSL